MTRLTVRYCGMVEVAVLGQVVSKDVIDVASRAEKKSCTW